MPQNVKTPTKKKGGNTTEWIVLLIKVGGETHEKEGPIIEKRKQDAGHLKGEEVNVFKDLNAKTEKKKRKKKGKKPP